MTQTYASLFSNVFWLCVKQQPLQVVVLTMQTTQVTDGNFMAALMSTRRGGLVMVAECYDILQQPSAWFWSSFPSLSESTA